MVYVESMSTRIEEYVCMHAGGMQEYAYAYMQARSVPTCHPNVPLSSDVKKKVENSDFNLVFGLQPCTVGFGKVGFGLFNAL
jgi:hypothetical protein